jgi:hypothetical protein
MELMIYSPPAAGYSPGDEVSGLLKYNITSEQETIYDAHLDFDGILSMNPFKFKYEACRLEMSLVGQSQVLFYGPFTMKRQLLAWTFTFAIPATVAIEDATFSLPPSMDHVFREGLRVLVNYNITATIRFGPGGGDGRRKTRLVRVKPSTLTTTLQRYSEQVSFPAVEFPACPKPAMVRSSAWEFLSRPEIDNRKVRQILHLQVELPSTLFYDQQETVTCCLRVTAEPGNTLGNLKFAIETFELVLRSRLMWENNLQIRRHIGTMTMRPGTAIYADGQSVSLPDTFRLQDFASDEELPLLHSYDSVIPNISLGFMFAVIVVLRHEISGQHLIMRATLPVTLQDLATKDLLPPAYQCHEVAEATELPPYS